MPEPAAKILVADDDQSLVRTLTWILKENGYEVVTAPGGEGLLGKLEDERPNLLLLDIMMPKVDGLQLLARMKADDRFRDVPVLMISSMPPEEATVKSLGLGAADFISKPFRVRELLARVKAHIRSAQELARATRRRAAPPSSTSCTWSPTPSSPTRSITSWCAAWPACCRSRSAPWCSPSPATSWAWSWRRTKTPCSATSRSS